MRTPPLALVVCSLAAMLLPSGGHAVSFGAVPANVPLGRPLAMAVPLRLEEGEAFDAECVAVEVTLGDRRVPAEKLQWALQPGPQPRDRVLRVVTLIAMDEPLVTVQLSVGCSPRTTRRFTLLTDPGASNVKQAVVDAAVARDTPTAAARASAAKTLEPLAANPQPGGQRESSRPAAPTEPALKPASRGAKPEARLPDVARQPVPEPSVGSAADAALQAASAAEATASAAAARVKALEEQVQRLTTDAASLQAESRQQRARSTASDALLDGWIWSVAAMLGLAAGGWVWWWRRTQRARTARSPVEGSDSDGALDDTDPGAGQTTDAAPTLMPPELSSATQAAPPPATPAPASVAPANAVMHETGWTTAPAPREVSVEELIDLEQQAEFFVALEQDDAAIDLLVGHIRSTGGSSPLPYLKLLEIYRRLGDIDNYERTRARFNQRFNAYAPDWSADLQHGRLLDDYPEVMSRLQGAWPDPLDAMAELEALLFRKADGQMFELPAYRDVLLLYSLARDLLQRRASPAVAIDLLLPLEPTGAADGAPRPSIVSWMDDTQPLPRHVSADRPTEPAPLDLDLGRVESLDGDFTLPGRRTDSGHGQDESRFVDFSDPGLEPKRPPGS